MNKTHHSLFVLAVASLALVTIGCGDSTVTPIDAGGHPDLGGGTDAGHDSSTPGTDLGTDTGTTPIDMGSIDGGVGDMGTTPVDGGPGHYTEAGCYEGTPVIMTDFLNHCVDVVDREAPAAVTGTGLRSTLLYPDGGVPPIP